MSSQLDTNRDRLAIEINDLHAQAESNAISAVESAAKCGQKLIAAKADCKHGEWLPWLEANCPDLAANNRSKASRYMRLAKYGVTPHLDSPEAKAQIAQIWGNADRANHQHITSSESVEWYTPALYVDTARNVMGKIDLDPASNPTANEIVKAGTYYTEEQDGLAQEWFGNVWMNPPYGKACAGFIDRVVSEYGSGGINQAIILINSNSNDTSWFRPLWDYTLCFTYGRINLKKAVGLSICGELSG